MSIKKSESHHLPCLELPLETFRITTAARISSTPIPDMSVKGSENTKMPISVATIGSTVARIPALLASTLRKPSV